MRHPSHVHVRVTDTIPNWALAPNVKHLVLQRDVSICQLRWEQPKTI